MINMNKIYEGRKYMTKESNIFNNSVSLKKELHITQVYLYKHFDLTLCTSKTRGRLVIFIWWF